MAHVSLAYTWRTYAHACVFVSLSWLLPAQQVVKLAKSNNMRWLGAWPVLVLSHFCMRAACRLPVLLFCALVNTEHFQSFYMCDCATSASSATKAVATTTVASFAPDLTSSTFPALMKTMLFRRKRVFYIYWRWRLYRAYKHGGFSVVWKTKDVGDDT